MFSHVPVESERPACLLPAPGLPETCCALFAGLCTGSHLWAYLKGKSLRQVGQYEGGSIADMGMSTFRQGKALAMEVASRPRR